MRRNIAFFVSSNQEENPSFLKAKEHFENCVKDFNYEMFQLNQNGLNIILAYSEELTISIDGDKISFPIGNLGDDNLKESDRFLSLEINGKEIKIVNDYAGTIPVYFSTRDNISLSNIEPCVVLGSNTTPQDFSPENVYGFLKYMHFIWDETAYKHIFCMLPDSEYKFDIEKKVFSSEYLKTIKSSEINASLSDEEVAKKLYDLNNKLVYDSLSKYDTIILPLSSGYDSRMILGALSKKEELKNKLQCFTYGSQGSTDVEAARRLTKKLGVKWNYIEMPCHFLERDILLKTHSIFGSSLHMHGMYQLEFFNQIKNIISISKNDCLTSGFMTGVPAGQHNGLLQIDKDDVELVQIMNKFSQSKYWPEQELDKLEIFKNKNYIQCAEERFKKAFNRFDGKIYQKSVVFDIWTRQRSFIGYYPRTLEWVIPTVSPHMNPEYINFFMSISERNLNNRRAVELMFSKHYPEISNIVSNSNGLKSINGLFENGVVLLSRVFRKLRISFLIPKIYSNQGFDFNTAALKFSKKEGIYPLLAENKESSMKYIYEIISKEEIERLYNLAINGDLPSYEKLITLQSLALTLDQINK